MATRSFIDNRRKVQQEPNGKGKNITSQSQSFHSSTFKEFEKEYKILESVVEKKRFKTMTKDEWDKWKTYSIGRQEQKNLRERSIRFPHHLSRKY